MPGGADVDRDVLRPALLVHVVELDAVEVHELAVERHGLIARSSARTASTISRMTVSGSAAVDADLGRQRIPPRADTEDHATGREVVERGEGRGEQRRVARPTVDDARSRP